METIDDCKLMPATTPPFSDLIGEHESIDALRKLLTRVARSKASTVLIYGETGTGKGMVARMIHEQSARADREFLDINCAAIPSDLLESELFGYEPGAFTGAVGKKQGLIETADNGTVFLDEIRELDPVMQAKILTLLDTRRFRRLGSVKPTTVDVRFIAATNKILLSEVKAGKFRDDLYYRLQVISVNIPPLRERGDDVFILTRHFLGKYNQRYGSAMRELDADVEHVFRSYPWPGNVRELENLLERICILEEGHRIRLEHLPRRIVREVEALDARTPALASTTPAPLPALDALAPRSRQYHPATAEFQRALIEQALREHKGNLGQAAVRLGLTRHALRHQMFKLGLAGQESSGEEHGQS
jgi:transcriptional regulator with PAS, ATPase and Fis domain